MENKRLKSLLLALLTSSCVLDVLCSYNFNGGDLKSSDTDTTIGLYVTQKNINVFLSC